MNKIVPQPSYRERAAACGAAPDKLLAANPDGPAITTAGFNVGYSSGDHINVHVDGLAAVVAWGRSTDRPIRRVYGTNDILQADVTITVDGVRISIMGSSRCANAGTEHDHDGCLAQATAEASTLSSEQLLTTAETAAR